MEGQVSSDVATWGLSDIDQIFCRSVWGSGYARAVPEDLGSIAVQSLLVKITNWSSARVSLHVRTIFIVPFSCHANSCLSAKDISH